MIATRTAALVAAFTLVACTGTSRDATEPDGWERATLSAAGESTDDATALAGTSNDAMLEAESEAGSDVAPLQVATAGRASGHFRLAAPFRSIVEERISFVGLSTDFPLAKGQIEVHALQANGVKFVVHAEVTCLSVLGNQAWLSGRATKVMINNRPVPSLVGITTSMRVEDNGEGSGSPPDRTSLVLFRLNSEVVCRTRPPFPLAPSAGGNIQVDAR